MASRIKTWSEKIEDLECENKELRTQVMYSLLTLNKILIENFRFGSYIVYWKFEFQEKLLNGPKELLQRPEKILELKIQRMNFHYYM